MHCASTPLPVVSGRLERRRAGPAVAGGRGSSRGPRRSAPRRRSRAGRGSSRTASASRSGAAHAVARRPTRSSSWSRNAVIASGSPIVDARREEVARVEADAESRMRAALDHRDELVDGAADRASCAGRVLEQQPEVVGQLCEHRSRAPAGSGRVRPRGRRPRCEPTCTMTASASSSAATSQQAASATRERSTTSSSVPARLIR